MSRPMLPNGIFGVAKQKRSESLQSSDPQKMSGSRVSTDFGIQSWMRSRWTGTLGHLGPLSPQLQGEWNQPGWENPAKIRDLPRIFSTTSVSFYISVCVSHPLLGVGGVCRWCDDQGLGVRGRSQHWNTGVQKAIEAPPSLEGILGS